MKSGFYSFAVHTLREIMFPEYRLILDPGMNAFNLVVPDVDAFLASLAEAEVDVRQVNRLDFHEEFDAIPILPTTAETDSPKNS